MDPIFIDTVVGFTRAYADRTHHRKEEDSLFRDLEKKWLRQTAINGQETEAADAIPSIRS